MDRSGITKAAVTGQILLIEQEAGNFKIDYANSCRSYSGWCVAFRHSRSRYCCKRQNQQGEEYREQIGQFGVPKVEIQLQPTLQGSLYPKTTQSSARNSP